MAELTFGTPAAGELGKLLTAEDIQPGDAPGYETCKRIFEYHPLGGKLAEKPIAMALSQERVIVIDGAPGDDVIEEFKRQRKELLLDEQTYRTGVLAKVYGISGMFIGIKDVEPKSPLTPEQLRDPTLYVNAVDPLNAAGSLVLNQNPLDPDYLKPRELSVSGTTFHRSRSIVLMNEMPIYLGWTDSAFGFSGRSVYQRILYNLKSYIETMRAADMLAKKCGVIVAKVKQQSSAANQIAAMFNAERRVDIKLAVTGNVLQIGPDDEVFSLDLTNLATVLKEALDSIREFISAGSGTPAILINEETFASGLSEGSEDAKYVAEFIEGVRKWIDPVFAFTDRIAQDRAWTPEFYQVIQQRYPEYRSKPYDTTVNEWRRQFKASWPPYLKESAGEQQKRLQEQLKSILEAFVAMFPLLDPANQVLLTDWFQDVINSLSDLVPSQLFLTLDTLFDHLTTAAEEAKKVALDPPEEDEENEPQPGQADKNKDALHAIADIRDRLRIKA